MRRPAAGHIQPWVYHQYSRNIRGGNTFTYLRNYDDLIMGKGLLASNQNSAENVNMQEYYDWLMPNKPNISYEDAYNLSQHYLQAMGIDLELHYSEPCTIVRQQVKKKCWLDIYVYKELLWFAGPIFRWSVGIYKSRCTSSGWGPLEPGGMHYGV